MSSPRPSKTFFQKESKKACQVLEKENGRRRQGGKLFFQICHKAIFYTKISHFKMLSDPIGLA